MVILAFILFVISDAKGQANLEKIDSVLESYFETLEGYVRDRNSDPSVRRTKIISFFERLTKIEGDGDGTYIGKLTCTEDDIKRWRTWIEAHKRDLVWNTSTRAIEKREGQ